MIQSHDLITRMDLLDKISGSELMFIHTSTLLTKKLLYIGHIEIFLNKILCVYQNLRNKFIYL